MGRQVKKLRQQLEQAKSSRSTMAPIKPKKEPVIIGCIKVKLGCTILLPPTKLWTKGAEKVCTPAMKSRGSGCKHPCCKWSHVHLKDWTKQTTKFTIDIIAKDKNLTWVPKVMTPKLSGLKFQANTENDDDSSLT